ncbi:MAG: T9SS type B sorting domain-containing protein [Bacteroidota bacterium]
MRYWLLYICMVFVPFSGNGQDCPDLLDPLPNAVNVPVDTSISWEVVTGIAGYIISIGTTPGGGEIVNEQNVGSDTTYTPPLGLPENTLIYVTITLFFFDQSNIECPSQSFTTENVTTVPDCTQLTNPVNGELDVNVGINLNWSYASRATGYRLTMGTAPGSGDIENNTDLGNTLSFNPTNDLPPGTEIFVRIVPYNENGGATGCLEESFTTGELGDPPGCTMLIQPVNGSTNVELSPLIIWEPVPDATGYIVNIGRSPFVNDVLDEAVFFTNSTMVINFEPNSTYFITIYPFNEAGRAQDCEQESFSTILGCGPFIDPITGELVTLSPVINFPDQVGICENSLPTTITSRDTADGFRWYQIRPSGDEVLISEERSVDISEIGPYRYEAYNIINQDGVEIECADGKEFSVIASSIATIDNIIIEEFADLFEVTIIVSGMGDYEFSLNDPEGPYTDDNTFTGLGEGEYTIYVRDKNGCGIRERPFVLAYPPTGFPTYFSPNDDGINDYWNYVPPREDPLDIVTIRIFDRYGKVLASFTGDSQGWDGRYQGSLMPSSSYWYQAITSDNQVYTGPFTLVRRRNF